MPVALVQVQVKPECIDAFIKETQRNHLGSITERGNRRFDVLQQSDDPTRFVLYEWFASNDDAVAHKQTAHYLAWRDAVADMMAAPRAAVMYSALLPKL